MIEAAIKNAIRDVPDFPKKGIVFKDITPILQDANLCRQIVAHMVEQAKALQVDVVVGVESRGFLFGPAIAQQLNIPFVPIRKAGKLPAACISETYELEYGSATIELHVDAFRKGDRVLIHDDLLATGGTVAAAAKLVKQLDGQIAGFSFLVDLEFLGGKKMLEKFESPICACVVYR